MFKQSMPYFMLFIFSIYGQTSLYGKDCSSFPEYKKEDSEYKYYVGRSVGLSDEKSAVTEAIRDVHEQAIRDNFGFNTKISTQTYETNIEASVVKQVESISKDINLKGLEPLEECVDHANGLNFQAKVLFKYSKDEIKKEETRLLTAKNTSTTSSTMTTIGNIADNAKGIIEISTTPDDAEISIDNKFYGRTPLRLIGKIAIGKHTILLNQENSVPLERDIIITSGKTLKINEKLKQAEGSITIATDPEDADIYINGKYQGKSPLRNYHLASGATAKILLKHHETYDYQEDVQISRSERKLLTFPLKYRSSTLTLQTIPQDANVFIDGNLSVTRVISLSRGKHQLIISKDGFETREESVYIRGGEKKDLNVIQLNSELNIPKTISKPVSNHPQKHPTEKQLEWKHLAGVGYSSSSISSSPINTGSIFLGTELQPSDRIRLRGEADLFFGYTEHDEVFKRQTSLTETRKRTKDVMGVNLRPSLPIYLSTIGDGNLSVGPHLNFQYLKYSESLENGGTTYFEKNKSFALFGAGGDIEYEYNVFGFSIGVTKYFSTEGTNAVNAQVQYRWN